MGMGGKSRAKNFVADNQKFHWRFGAAKGVRGDGERKEKPQTIGRDR